MCAQRTVCTYLLQQEHMIEPLRAFLQDHKGERGAKMLGQWKDTLSRSIRRLPLRIAECTVDADEQQNERSQSQPADTVALRQVREDTE